jgi:hypothetical protein
MIKYLSDKLEQWSKVGIKAPFFHDPTTDKPSITLMFPYVSFTLLIISSIALHFFPSLIIASLFMAMIWIASTVFYMIRKINKAKIDFDDKQLELEGGE